MNCGDGVTDVEWSLLRARVLEQLGRRRDAIESYSLVVRAWRTADPELQPVTVKRVRSRTISPATSRP